MDTPDIARNLVTTAGATVRGFAWLDADGGKAKSIEDAAALSLQLNVGRGIRTLRIDRADVAGLADLLPGPGLL